MNPERGRETRREAELMNGRELVEAYLAGEEVLGKEIMARCLDRTGNGHLADEPLAIHGNVLTTAEGQPVTFKDYLQVAKENNHTGAVEAILYYTTLDPNQPGYDDMTQAMGSVIEGYAYRHKRV